MPSVEEALGTLDGGSEALFVHPAESIACGVRIRCSRREVEFVERRGVRARLTEGRIEVERRASR